MQFYSLRVREVRRETPECVSVSFEVPENQQDIFQYKQGQYLTIRTHLNGEEVRRSYSVCTAPFENDLRVAVKKVEDGLFSTFANEVLKAGDTLEVMPPEGRFSLESNAAAQHLYVAFAAGSGITPIISILKAVLHNEPGSRFMLFYGNRGFDQIIFREQLEDLKNKFPDQLSVNHVFSRESMANDLFQGHLNGDKCSTFAKYFFQPEAVDTYFLCGPEEMIFSVKDQLVALGIDTKKIKFELFTTANSIAKKAATKPKSTAPSMEASVTVIQDGAEFDFRLPSDGSTLLDAAMRAGADLPFSCKGGVCSTCKAKVLEGEVEMDINYGLEEDEVAEGYVLTCQSHPKTSRVVVTFDV